LGLPPGQSSLAVQHVVYLSLNLFLSRDADQATHTYTSALARKVLSKLITNCTICGLLHVHNTQMILRSRCLMKSCMFEHLRPAMSYVHQCGSTARLICWYLNVFSACESLHLFTKAVHARQAGNVLGTSPC
jgi:hypothetical protein